MPEAKLVFTKLQANDREKALWLNKVNRKTQYIR